MPPQAGYLRQHTPPSFNIQAHLSKDAGFNRPHCKGARWTKSREYRHPRSHTNHHHSIGDGTIPGDQDNLQTKYNLRASLQIAAIPLRCQINEGTRIQDTSHTNHSRHKSKV